MSMNQESPTRVVAIESWFHQQDDGGIVVTSRNVSPAVSGDLEHARTIVYTTKPHCLRHIQGISELSQPVASIGRYGLPGDGELKLLRGSTVPCRRLFLGDADPPDLLVFAWLREHVPITWHGVSDDFLDRNVQRNREDIQIPLSPTESSALPLLPAVCPDYRALLGEYCASLLDRHLKIELEGAVQP